MKLTLLTNKAIMSLDPAQAQYANENYGADASRTFISGLKRNLTDELNSSKSEDLPIALAMALEIEANHDRHSFASNFAKTLKERSLRQGLSKNVPINNNARILVNHRVPHVSQILSPNSLNGLNRLNSLNNVDKVTR